MINLFNKTNDFIKKYKIYLVKQDLAGPDMFDFRLLVQFARFRSKHGILTKWHNDSASFLPEKLKNQVILIKILIFDAKSKKNTQQIPENLSA